MTNPPDTGLTQAFIAKIDPDGNVIWREDYGEDGRNAAAHLVREPLNQAPGVQQRRV